MISLSDLKYIRDIEFSLRNFAWSIVGSVLMYVVSVTTAFVVGFQTDKDFIEILKTIPYGLMIATIASALVFPILDLREYILDRVMCRELDWDYEADFVRKFTPKQLEKVRENYIKLTAETAILPQIKERQESFVGNLTRK
jgi:hypothetical protein